MKKEYRLKKSHEIAAVVQKRERIGGEYYTLYYNFTQKRGRIAISVNKKFGNAVERNYAKRIVREIFKNELLDLPQCDIVVVVKATSKVASFDKKAKELLYQLNKLKRKENSLNEQIKKD